MSRPNFEIEIPEKWELLDQSQQRGMKRIMQPESSNVMVFWWSVGTGKTRLALFTFLYSDYQDLIVVCRRISFDDWMDEMEICHLDFTVYTDDYEPNSIKKFGKLQKRVLLISSGSIDKIPECFPKGQMLAVDELYLYANPRAKRSKHLHKISLFCSARIGLSGTIMSARNNMSIFGQLWALNAHHPLASGTSEFISKFQTRGQGRFGTTYINLPGSVDKITKLLANRVDIHFPSKRPTRTQILKVDSTEEQRAYIRALKQTYEHKGHEYKFAIQVVNAINGISNGWHVNEEGKLSCYKSNKLTKLFSLVEEIVSQEQDNQVVIWCHYHNDIGRIAIELKLPWLEFTARKPFDEEKWKSNKFKVVLATEANGASVNHFKHVKYAIYFSMDYSMLNLEQSKGRHERKGSEHDGAHYYFLQTRGTLDSRIYQLVTQSKASEETIIKSLYKQLYTEI